MVLFHGGVGMPPVSQLQGEVVLPAGDMSLRQ